MIQSQNTHSGLILLKSIPKTERSLWRMQKSSLKRTAKRGQVIKVYFFHHSFKRQEVKATFWNWSPLPSSLHCRAVNVRCTVIFIYFHFSFFASLDGWNIFSHVLHIYCKGRQYILKLSWKQLYSFPNNYLTSLVIPQGYIFSYSIHLTPRFTSTTQVYLYILYQGK